MFRAFRSGLFFVVICGSACIAHAQANRFVSNDVCRTCHPTIWNSFYKNPHFKSVASGKEPPESTGCQGCHGPAGNHVDNGGGKDTIRAFSVLPADASIGHLPPLPQSDALPGQYPELPTHFKWDGMYQLPFDSSLPIYSRVAPEAPNRAV